MKNAFILPTITFICTLFFVFPSPAADSAEDTAMGIDFIEQFVEDEEALNQARDTSRDLLEAKPTILMLRENEEKLLEESAKRREQLAKKLDEKRYLEDKKKSTIKDVTTRLTKAPFGLYWDATLEEMKTMDVLLTPIKRENYDAAYRVANPQQKHTTFNPVIAIFGKQNHLWCIYAQSKPIRDEANASKILKLYRQYYEALKSKYGDDMEYFTPYTYVEEKVEGEGDEKVITKVTHQNPLGGENFLQELQTGKASLYATFEGADMGITLGVNVDEYGKSSITIDYKNLRVMRKEKNSNLENLMDDL